MLSARARPQAQTSPSAVLQRLERAVRCCQEFRLCFIQCDDPVLQEQMCTGLLQRLRGKPVLDVRLEQPVASLLGELLGKAPSRPAAVLIRGLEHTLLTEGAASFLRRWEAELDQLRGRYPAFILIWLPQAALESLEGAAPGLWAQRSAVYEVYPLHASRAAEPVLRAPLREAVPATANGVAAVEEVEEAERPAVPETEPAVQEPAPDERPPETAPQDQAPDAQQEEEEEDELEPAGGDRRLPPLHSMTLAQKQAEIDRRMLKLQETVLSGPSPDVETQRLQASLLYEIGVLNVSIGEWGRAAASLEESAATFHMVDDRQARGAALLQLGVARHNQGKLEDAEGLYELSIQIARERGDRSTEALALHQLGMVAQARGDAETAAERFEQSLEVKREIRDRRGEAATLHQLGSLRQRNRDLAGAIRLYQESIEIKRELGDRAGLSTTLHQLGTAEHQQGHLDEAMRYYEESLQIKKSVGDRAGTAGTLGQIGRIHQQRGQLREALQHYATSWLMFRSLGSQYAPIAQKLIQGIRSQAGEEQFENWLRNDLRSIAAQIRKALVEEA